MATSAFYRAMMSMKKCNESFGSGLYSSTLFAAWLKNHALLTVIDFMQDVTKLLELGRLVICENEISYWRRKSFLRLT